LIDTPLKIMHL